MDCIGAFVAIMLAAMFIIICFVSVITNYLDEKKLDKLKSENAILKRKYDNLVMKYTELSYITQFKNNLKEVNNK